MNFKTHKEKEELISNISLRINSFEDNYLNLTAIGKEYHLNEDTVITILYDNSFTYFTDINDDISEKEGEYMDLSIKQLKSINSIIDSVIKSNAYVDDKGVLKDFDLDSLTYDIVDTFKAISINSDWKKDKVLSKHVKYFIDRGYMEEHGNEIVLSEDGLMEYYLITIKNFVDKKEGYVDIVKYNTDYEFDSILYKINSKWEILFSELHYDYVIVSYLNIKNLNIDKDEPINYIDLDLESLSKLYHWVIKLKKVLK